MTREEWLNKAMPDIRMVFEQSGIKWKVGLKLRIACGWPCKRALSKRGRRIGECHVIESSGDNVNEIFISPVLHDPVAVLSVEVHEIIHAMDNCKSGHKGYFKTAMKAVGLEGKATATHAGTELTARLNAIASKLGPYPHRTLDPATREKVQTTRLLKITCPECGYTARVTRQWIETGLPVCPCGQTFKEVTK